MPGPLSAEALLARFVAAGAQVVTPEILQPAGTLLDLYGEDIRARAFVTHDPFEGEMMLRPDFTVPVVQTHMIQGGEPARYAYCGPVFRRQEAGERARQHIQVGFELFARHDPAEADAEVFALFSRLLAEAPVRAVTGDIGVLIAAVDALSTTPARRAALRRHIWRPRRFRALMERFSRPAKPRTPAPTSAPEIGLRSAQEVEARLQALASDAETPPISALEADVLNGVLAVAEMAPVALSMLRDIAVDLPGLTPNLNIFETRLEALSRQGIDADALPFEATYGRSQMEYYDGFVFGFSGPNPADPPVATGGRYDALTAMLGRGRAIPAVGGVIRPEVLEGLV